MPTPSTLLNSARIRLQTLWSLVFKTDAGSRVAESIRKKGEKKGKFRQGICYRRGSVIPG